MEMQTQLYNNKFSENLQIWLRGIISTIVSNDHKRLKRKVINFSIGNINTKDNKRDEKFFSNIFNQLHALLLWEIAI